MKRKTIIYGNTFAKINFWLNLQMSFPRRRESTRVVRRWILAYATKFRELAKVLMWIYAFQDILFRWSQFYLFIREAINARISINTAKQIVNPISFGKRDNNPTPNRPSSTSKSSVPRAFINYPFVSLCGFIKTT